MSSTHLTILEHAASHYSSQDAFRIAQLDPTTGNVAQWKPITYGQFAHDVEVVAKYWSRIFRTQHIPPRSVIGMWIAGYSYTDLVQIYGLSRAGFIPQLFSLRLPNPEVIYELLKKAGASALIYESGFENVLHSCPIPTHRASDVSEMSSNSSSDEPLAPLPTLSPQDTAFYFHTSGSTSGSPKLVPVSYQGVGAAFNKLAIAFRPRDLNRQDVCTWMGSVCHVGQSFAFLGRMHYGSCTLIPSTMMYDDDEFVSMVVDANLNCLNQFSGFLVNRLKTAMNDTKLATLLKGLDQVLYCGLPLAPEQEDWAIKQGLRTTNLFGGTEIAGGLALLSVGSGPYARLFKPIEGTSYAFVPIAEEGGAGKHQSTGRLLEFVVLADSPDCPAKSLRSSDGNFHTGDLFIEPVPGHYAFKGRNDDWIKSENSLRCDTKSIEDNVYHMCSGLVAACVVVGSGRPSPTLFVEPSNPDMDVDKLKKEILRKTRPFHARRYMHERIVSPNNVVIVAPQSLPRTATKGNIRRQQVEELYKTQLDQIYAGVAR